MTDMTDTNVALVPTIGERMKMALNYSGKTVNEMAAFLEVNPVSASRWITGVNPAKAMVIKLWAAETGVNEEWLRTGKIPAEAIVRDSKCARRDSNSQPSDWESAGLRRALLAFGIRAGLPAGDSLEFFEFVDEIVSAPRQSRFSSLAGLASFSRLRRRRIQCQVNPDTRIANGVGVE